MQKRESFEAQNLTQSRKDEHLEICLTQDVNSEEKNFWNLISLPHRALPEIDFHSIHLETKFLGTIYKRPYLISSMTGGSPQTDFINERLVLCAQDHEIPMGVGSMRTELESREGRFLKLRKLAPRAKLFANIGAVQLNYGVTVEDCQFLIDSIEAEGLFLHLNPLQEAIQKEGDRNFSGLLKKIKNLCQKISVPVIAKETGSGLDVKSAKQLIEAGVTALDVAGLGGSHWGYIEGLRNASRRNLGELFRNWGIPSPKALIGIREIFSGPLIGSGGLRSGLDAAKAIYLGADLCGFALPFLKAAHKSSEELKNFVHQLDQELRVALFCTGSQDPFDLKQKGIKDLEKKGRNHEN